MSRHRIAILFGVSCICFDPARAEGPTPRGPVGPQMMEMLPPANTNPSNMGAGPRATLPDDRIRIQNIGNQTLHLSYWDSPQSTWQTISLSTSEIKDVVCVQCGSTITVAFHNGKENKIIQAKTGTAYVLAWSPRSGSWDLTPQAPSSR